MKKIFLVILFAFLLGNVIDACSAEDSSKCCICRDDATDMFQGSGYCREHYMDAIIWAMENVSK